MNGNDTTTIPLADRMRPVSLDEVVGQEHLIGEGKTLRLMMEKSQIFSMIFWGPPGSGKTTLARLVSQEMKADFIEHSATSTGVADVRKVVKEAQENKKLDGRKTVLFIDEIHRFSKAQQDAFLPYVEDGTIVLVGATTENPSFEVISPLLSRMRVFTLKSLTHDNLKTLIERALGDSVRGIGTYKKTIAADALDFLIEIANGDSRIALNTLEVAATLISQHPEITLNDIEEAYQHKALRYDKAGEEHYDTISAFIKSMRASNPDAALYYMARMVNAGEDPLFIARRMVVFASEDIGMAQPTALVVANGVFQACNTIGYPECAINLAHGVVYLASCPKNRSAYDGLRAAQHDVEVYGNLPIPLNLRNAETKLMKELGYGKGYEKYTKEDLLPDKLKGKKYYISKEKV